MKYANLPATLYYYPRDAWPRHRTRVCEEETVWIINPRTIPTHKASLFVCMGRDSDTLALYAAQHLETYTIIDLGPFSMLVNGVAFQAKEEGEVLTETTVIDLAYTVSRLAFVMLKHQHQSIVGCCCVDADSAMGVVPLAGVGVLGKGAVFSDVPAQPFLSALAHKHGMQVLADDCKHDIIN